MSKISVSEETAYCFIFDNMEEEDPSTL